MNGRRISTTLFAATVLAFLLPFGTVACEPDEVSFTGLELATYRVTDGGDLDEQVEAEASWAAFAVLVAAATGLGLSAAGRKGAGVCAAAALVGMQALLWIAAATLATVSLRVGFWFALGLAAATGAWQLGVALRTRRDLGRSRGPAVAAAVLVLLPGLLLGTLIASALADASAAGAAATFEPT